MEFMKRLEPVWLALVLLGALNWALVALFDFNVVEEILGTGTAADVVYVIVGPRGRGAPAAAGRGPAPRRSRPPARRLAAQTRRRRAGGAHPAQPDSREGVRLPACPPGDSTLRYGGPLLLALICVIVAGYVSPILGYVLVDRRVLLLLRGRAPRCGSAPAAPAAWRQYKQ